MRIVPLLVLPTVALVTLSGCSLVPRGPLVSESRDIDRAQTVVLNTSGDITIREGAPSLIITAADSVLDRLTSSVDDGVLVLGVKPGTPGFLLGPISYELTLPSVEGLEINGSGDIDSDVPTGSVLGVTISGSGDVSVESIDASRVVLDIRGSGDVELEGRADDVEILIAGSGEVTADELDSTNVTVKITGSGDVEVAASSTLDVSIAGAGDVVYVGRPEVTQSIAGSGNVSQR